MTDSSTIESARQLILQKLSALGDTPKAVADTLARGGHRGNPEDCSDCPVALYLAYEIPGMQFSVRHMHVDVTIPDDMPEVPLTSTITVEMPGVVYTFIRLFDSGGAFQDLVIE